MSTLSRALSAASVAALLASLVQLRGVLDDLDIARSDLNSTSARCDDAVLVFNRVPKERVAKCSFYLMSKNFLVRTALIAGLYRIGMMLEVSGPMDNFSQKVQSGNPVPFRSAARPSGISWAS
jgi:hypothetical protein